MSKLLTSATLIGYFPKLAIASLYKVAHIEHKSDSFASIEHTLPFNCCKILLVSTKSW